jgi:hypothetical protein
VALHPGRDLIRALMVCAFALGAASVDAAPQKVLLNTAVATAQWPLAAFDPALSTDWTDAQFLVLEIRASSSQRFELGIVTDEATITRNIHPFADVWVRASIPLRFYRQEIGDAPDLASAMNQPRTSYWINLEAGGHAPLQRVSAISVTMRHPVHAATIEVRSVALSKTDPGDAVLDGGTPLLDDFGQYIHADWPEKARAPEALVREWQSEQRMLVPKAPVIGCRYGGYTPDKRRATGFFRVEKIGERWWFIDPEGCRFYSAGVSGAGGEPPRTEIIGRSKLFAGIPTGAQLPAPGTDADPLRDPISFYLANQQLRFGEDWRLPNSQLTSRRMRAWGLNTAYGPALNETLLATPTMKQPYVLPLTGWQRSEGAIMGLPDVYSDTFAKRVEAEASQQLSAHKDDPWMIGYFIGNEPAWPTREGQLVDIVLAGPKSALQQKFRSELAKGDTPATRKAMVHAAFSRYLDIVNAAARRADPDHLNLGTRFGGTVPDDVVSLTQGFDVFSMNLYRSAPTNELINHVYSIAKLPILISGFSFGVPEHGMAAGRMQVVNQAERGVAYSYYVEHAAEHPAIVGTHWNQWIDEPVTGRRDGENFNIGWIDVTDRPYPELVAAAKATHAKLDAIHSARLAPTTRKARASDFGTPEDP